jgi:hypothetical protein
MHRLTRLLILATFAVVWLACGVAHADYVTVTQGGYGPFTCTRDGGGPLPSWGFSERFVGSFYYYGCQRYRGDIQTSTHAGHSYDFIPAGDPYLSVKVSPQYTTHYACYDLAPGNTPVPCDGGYKVVTSDDPYVDDWRNASVIGYLPSCPAANGATFNTIHFCAGSYTPYDGSGLVTAVIGDGHVAPGLPYGNPLKLQPTVGNDVSCVATMSNYPNVPSGGHAVLMAVYTCP